MSSLFTTAARKRGVVSDAVVVDLTRFGHLPPFDDEWARIWSFEIDGVVYPFEGSYGVCRDLAQRQARKLGMRRIHLVHVKR